MNVYSWNVNGLRAVAKKGFTRWLRKSGADVVGLQEVRATPDQLTPAVRKPRGWKTAFVPAERKGYSGVGLYAKDAFDVVDMSIGTEFDVEGRLQAATFGELLIVNGYFPNGNGKNRDLSRIPYKLTFYDRLLKHLQSDLDAGKPILVMGDFNTAHKEIDLARPKQNRKTSGFRREEREAFVGWLEAGWTDTFRYFHKGGGHYSWWSQRKGVRAKNVGWRLDYIMASPGAMTHLTDAWISKDVMGSDHCPIGVSLDPKVVGI